MHAKMWIGFTLILALTLSISCTRKERPVIAVVPKGQALHYWQAVRAGAMAAGQEFGAEIRWNSPASEVDFTRQINIVDDFINQRVAGIVLAPSHGESLVPIVERAAQEKIAVVIFDSGIQTDKYLTYISTDNYAGGVLAARRMGEILTGGGNIAMVGTLPGSVSTSERENGFRETIARQFPRLQIVEFQYGMSDQAKSVAVTKSILMAHPDLLGIFCSNEPGTLGAAQAAQYAHMAKKLKIVGFDSAPSLIQNLQDGDIDSLVVQDPFQMGYLGVKAIVDHLHGRSLEKHMNMGATLVTAANLKEAAIQKLVFPVIDKYLSPPK